MKTLKILAASVLLVSGMTVKSFAGASYQHASNFSSNLVGRDLSDELVGDV
jgi:hypothetical protein